MGGWGSGVFVCEGEDGAGESHAADGEGVFIDIEARGVEMVDGLEGCADAEAEHAARAVLEVAGEILAAHAGEFDGLAGAEAGDAVAGLDAGIGQARVVGDRRDGEVDGKGGGNLAGEGDAIHDFAEALPGGAGLFLIGAANGAAELDGLRNDIGINPPLNDAEGNDEGDAGVGGAGELGVDSLDQLGGGGQGIEGGVGAGSVAAGAFEEDFEFLGAGGQGAVPVANLAGGRAGSTWRAMMAATCWRAPASIISRAPVAVSSAG